MSVDPGIELGLTVIATSRRYRQTRKVRVRVRVRIHVRVRVTVGVWGYGVQGRGAGLGLGVGSELGLAPPARPDPSMGMAWPGPTLAWP